MVAFPNTLLIRGERDYLVDPGLIMQGAPLIGALGELGVDAERDQGRDPHPPALRPRGGAGRLAERTDLRPPARDRGALRPDRRRPARERVNLEVLDGEEGEIEPGLRWIRTPGHCDGLITLLVDTDDGLVAIASDCVGPLPEYFDEMDLPEDFGPEREELLRAVAADPRPRPSDRDPGHNPPVQARR